ncbi:MAG: atpE [Clostridiales bacterium]|jgi:V/A-type H+-transporting ATPase subunit E|nr:atpE [Clostridiales bacterium]
MTGLETIIKHIEGDAFATARYIISVANDKAKEIAAVAQAEINTKRSEIEERNKLELEAIISRSESAALLQGNKLILQAKQQLINNVIVSAKDSLVKLPNDEYFKVIIKMVKKYALAQPGQIAFSKSDKERLPEQFGTLLQTALAEKTGASLVISEETRNINGGFVLIYGDVEENCSFDALILASKESLQDNVSKVLFE